MKVHKAYARQAITTRYLGPTNRRGSRVKATCDAGTFTLGCDDSMSALQNHILVAKMLAEKNGVVGKLLCRRYTGRLCVRVWGVG